jgi:hypothetical protein
LSTLPGNLEQWHKPMFNNAIKKLKVNNFSLSQCCA